MGLDFSHGGAHWSYGGFHRYRERLAKEIGIDLDSMEGYGGLIKWGDPKEEPLVDFLNHSDCEGDLSPGRCGKIWKRLRAVTNSWPEDDYDKIQTIKLADGMRQAHQYHQRLRFR